jgi:ubiquinone/menaquinone biosynthesis C-methylase UbiE
MPPRHFDSSYGTSAPENYERFFVPAIGRPLAQQLVQRASLRPGERVLDVGCGTGIVARLAAERIAPGGSVVGLDVNPGMLAVAKQVTPPDVSVEWHQASAEVMPLPDDRFDAVLCQMSLQFVPDRARALKEIRRVLAADGRCVLNLPGPEAPLFEVLAESMARHIAPDAAGFVRHVFSLNDEGEIRALLEDAGFRQLEVAAEEQDLPLPAPRDFLWQYIGGTPLSSLVRNAGAAANTALEDEVVARWQPHVEGEGMTLRQRVVTATARK